MAVVGHYLTRLLVPVVVVDLAERVLRRRTLTDYRLLFDERSFRTGVKTKHFKKTLKIRKLFISLSCITLRDVNLLYLLNLDRLLRNKENVCQFQSGMWRCH